MTVRRHSSSPHAWYIDFHYNGLRIRKRSPIQTEIGALRYEREFKAELVAREEAHREIEFWRMPTLSHFAEDWRTRHVLVRNRPSTIETHTIVMRRHILPAFGRVPLDMITTDGIDRFTAELSRRGLAPKTINNILSVLRSCLNLAREWGRIQKLPRIRNLKVPDTGVAFLSEDALSRLIQAADEGYWRTLILFFANTGARFGEVAALRWEDVDLGESPRVLIRRTAYKGVVGPTKTNRARAIPLAPDICEALQRLSRRGEHVFADEEGRLLDSERSLQELRHICALTGHSAISWHTLRHTFASHLVERQVNLRVIQELLGHTTIKVTERYTHVTRIDLVTAVGMLQRC
jgi:integrase